MKNSKILFLLMVTVMSSACTLRAEEVMPENVEVVSVEQVVLEEVTPAIIDTTRNRKQLHPEDLFQECNRSGNIVACQQLVGMMMYQAVIDKHLAQTII